MSKFDEALRSKLELLPIADINEIHSAIKSLIITELLPGEKYDPTKACQPDYTDDYTSGKVVGHNQCRDIILTKLKED